MRWEKEILCCMKLRVIWIVGKRGLVPQYVLIFFNLFAMFSPDGSRFPFWGTHGTVRGAESAFSRWISASKVIGLYTIECTITITLIIIKYFCFFVCDIQNIITVMIYYWKKRYPKNDSKLTGSLLFQYIHI